MTTEGLIEALGAKTKIIEAKDSIIDAQKQLINQYEKMLGIQQWGAFVVVWWVLCVHFIGTSTIIINQLRAISPDRIEKERTL